MTKCAIKHRHLSLIRGFVVIWFLSGAWLHAQEAYVGGGVSPEANWMGWFCWVFVVMALGGLVVFWVNMRLQSQIRRQTQVLRASEARMRNLFENTPVAIVEADFSMVYRWLLDLKKQGVSDLGAYLHTYPGQAEEKFSWVKILAANRTVFRQVRVNSVEEYERLIRFAPSQAMVDTFLAQLQCMWEEQSEMTRQLRYRGVDGREGHSLLHWCASEEEGGPDYSRVQMAFTDLSAVRATEEKLRDVEDRWRLAVISINAGIWEFNFTTGETYISDRWLEILGYPASEIKNAREEFWPRVHPGDVNRVRQAMRDYLEGHLSSYCVEFRMRCKDGNYKWILSRAMALFDQNGKPLRLIGAHTDIDESKCAEQLLRRSEERYRLLFENSPVAIIEYDLRGLRAWIDELRRDHGVADFEKYAEENAVVFQSALKGAALVGLNRATLRLVGAECKEAILESVSKIATADMVKVRRSLCRALWDGHNSMEGEMHLRDLNGVLRTVWYRWWAPVFNGEPNYALTQVMLVDLTNINNAKEALAAERERLSVTLRAMAEGVITTDTEGRVRFLNRAAMDLTGWSEGIAIGRALEDVCVLRNDKTREAVPALTAAAIKKRGVVDVPLHTVLLDRQGVPKTVEGKCASIYDANNQPVGAVVVLRDVTERVRLEGEILRASKLESVGILAGGIAHDFNNLLTVVMGNITLAMLDTQAMATAGNWLQDAEKGVMRARDLTQQLLTFARGGDPIRSAVHLAEVVKEAASFALHGANVRCQFKIEKDLWTAEVDKGQIGQVVQNLVINAVQAMPEGGAIEVEMYNKHLDKGEKPQLDSGNYVCILIRDTGMGISPENLTRIFDPYFTTKKTGTGLGLATVYSVIRKHAGHIEVESELGRGTCFRFWLPASPGTKPAPIESVVLPSEHTGRVLFMDDEEPVRLVGEALLRRLGFEVTLATDGQAAVNAYVEAMQAGRRFDLVIMDLTVPGRMGGQQAMAELVHLDPSAKGIVSSGYSSDPVMANYKAYGFSGTVAKPYRLTELAKTIRGVMEGGLD